MNWSPTLDQIIGQAQAVSRLRALAELTRTQAPVHFLLVGPDGSGKCTLAGAFANALGTTLIAASGPAIERGVDLMGILTKLEERSVLFFEDIDRLPRPVEDLLVPALRDFTVDFVVDKGPHARTLKYALRPFTCIVATDKESSVSSRLRSLFPVTIPLQVYSDSELSQLAQALAKSRGFSLAPDAAALLGKAARGRPQQLQSLLKLIEPSAGDELTGPEATRVLSSLGLHQGEASSHTMSKPSDDFMRLSGVEFEQVIAGLLTRLGFRVELTKTTGDGGIDIIAFLDKPIVGGRYLVQCKRFAEGGLVGAPVVREFYGAFTADRSAVKAILITTADFTAQARHFADGLPIELVNGEQLQDILRSSQAT